MGKKGYGGDDKRTTLLASDGHGPAAVDDAWGLAVAPLRTLPAVGSSSAGSDAGGGAAGGAAPSTGYTEMRGAGCGMGGVSIGGGSGGFSREQVAGSALGLCIELGMALEMDIRALLFWERAFVLYFTQQAASAGAPPLPKQRSEPLFRRTC